MKEKRTWSRASPQRASIDVDVAAIVDLVDVPDVEARYEEIRGWLQIPADLLNDRGTMVERLNESASMALAANELYLKVRRVCLSQKRKVLGGIRALKRKATLRIKDWQHVHGGGKALSDKMIDEEILGSPTLSGTYGKIMDEVEQLDAVVEAFHELWHRARGRESLLQSQSRLAFPDKMVTVNTR